MAGARALINMKRIDITRLAVWMRALLFAVLVCPMLTSKLLHSAFHPDHFLLDLIYWTLYANVLWLFVIACVGEDRFIDWIKAPALFGLTTLASGIVLKDVGAWKILESYFGVVEKSSLQFQLGLLYRFVVIIATSPLLLLAVHSFPASEGVRWVSKRGASRRTYFVLRLSLFLRILQLVAETVPRHILAWKEENPKVIWPRFRDNWQGSIPKKATVAKWVLQSVAAFCQSLAMQVLEALPMVVRDFRQIERVKVDTYDATKSRLD
jgi:hypothetical protein